LSEEVLRLIVDGEDLYVKH